MIIKKIILFFINILASRKYRAFHDSLNSPVNSQKKTKKKIEQLYYNSEFYKLIQKDFDDLPLHSYQDLEPYIDNQLTPKHPMFHEMTSGSSGKNKKIPYTLGLLSSFRNMFLIWTKDLTSNYKFQTHKVFISVSTQVDNKNEGLEDDSQYLGKFLSIFSKPFLIQIEDLKKIENEFDFKHIISLFLISNRDLEIISIWSPTYLLEIIHHIQNNHLQLRTDLNNGFYKTWRFTSISLASLEPKSCFPSLKLISCWGSSTSKYHFQGLKEKLHWVKFQKKGLLATEGPYTIPIIEAKGFLPLLNEIYYEFIDKDGSILSIDQLQKNQTYELIISQFGGLYRYKTNDLVKCTHYYKSTPCLDFIGRSGIISDIVGEKISEQDVINALANTAFRAMVPEVKQRRYILLIDSSEQIVEKSVEEIEKNLCENYHYHYARKIGQLKRLKILSFDNLEEKITLFQKDYLKISRGDQKIQYLFHLNSEQLLKYLNLNKVNSSN